MISTKNRNGAWLKPKGNVARTVGKAAHKTIGNVARTVEKAAQPKGNVAASNGILVVQFVISVEVSSSCSCQMVVVVVIVV